MKKQALTTLLLAFITLGMTSSAMAATPASSDDSEQNQVTVNVEPETALDVKPDSLNYENVQVGQRVESSSNGHEFGSVKVENTGSNPIQRVWIDSELPTSDPFGSNLTGTDSSHVSTNFLQVRPTNTNDGVQGDSSTFHYVERVEYLQEDDPLVELDGFDVGTPQTDVGRFRFGNNEFYFALQYGADGVCESGTLRVANEATTPSELGTVDFSSDGNWTEYSVSSASQASESGVGITNESVTFEAVDVSDDDGANDDTDGAGAETYNYDVLTQCSDYSGDGPTEPHVVLSKYDVKSKTTDNLEALSADYTTKAIWNTVGSGTDMEPGSSFGIDIAVQVPRGVPSGDISQGTMTVLSEAAP